MFDMGVIVAGTNSLAKEVYIENLAGTAVKNIQAEVLDDPNENVDIYLSESNNPFIPEKKLFLNGTLGEGEERKVYVRVDTKVDAKSGGSFKIRTKAEPV